MMLKSKSAGIYFSHRKNCFRQNYSGRDHDKCGKNTIYYEVIGGVVRRLFSRLGTVAAYCVAHKQLIGGSRISDSGYYFYIIELFLSCDVSQRELVVRIQIPVFQTNHSQKCFSENDFVFLR